MSPTLVRSINLGDDADRTSGFAVLFAEGECRAEARAPGHTKRQLIAPSGPQVRRWRVVIAVAGMEGALFSVIAGLVAAPVIAVPTSVGYGVAEGGMTALHAALASCAPGVVVVNIDNGFGAATAAIKMLNAAAA